jgi:SHS2 domain-containing protein
MSLESNKDYEVIEHTADIGIRVSGESIREIFCKAIHATVDLLSGGIKIEPVIEREFSTKEENIKTAFVGILEEVIYFFEKDLFLPSVCSINIEKGFYEVFLKGDTVSLEKIKNGIEIKAVTYHQLEIQAVGDGFQASVIFDV